LLRRAHIVAPVPAPSAAPGTAPRTVPVVAAPRIAPAVAPKPAPCPLGVSHEVRITESNAKAAKIRKQFFFMNVMFKILIRFTELRRVCRGAHSSKFDELRHDPPGLGQFAQ